MLFHFHEKQLCTVRSFIIALSNMILYCIWQNSGKILAKYFEFTSHILCSWSSYRYPFWVYRKKLLSTIWRELAIGGETTLYEQFCMELCPHLSYWYVVVRMVGIDATGWNATIGGDDNVHWYEAWNKTWRMVWSMAEPCLTHLPLVPHIYLSELGHHWFR